MPPISLLLLLLSCFSHVWLCATPEMAAHQAPPSLGFSKQEHWSGLPFPSPMHESEKWKWSRSGVSDSLRPHGLHPTRLLRPWDFPGKSTGVGCHCLLWRALHTYIFFFFCCVTWSTHSLSRDQTYTPCIECRPLTTEAPDKSIVLAVLMTNFLYVFIEFCAMLKLLELCLTLDCSPLGSSVSGVFQARILEWAAMTLAGDLPNPGIKPLLNLLPWHTGSLPVVPPGKPIEFWEVFIYWRYRFFIRCFSSFEKHVY